MDTPSLILHGLAPMHWAAAGACIAAITLLLLYLANRRLGLSSGFEDVCSLVLAAPYFKRASLLSARPWRLPLVVGLVVGGFVSAWLGGGWAPTWDVGPLDRAAAFGRSAKLAWMFAGGVLIGYGTRLGGGCTSGHGIFGLSNLEWPSLAATLSFMGAGIVAANVLYRLVFA